MIRVACSLAVGAKLSHTSYQQLQKPVSHSVSERETIFGKAQNGMVNHQNKYLNKVCVPTVSVFLLTSFCSFLQFSLNFSIIFL